MDSIDVYYSLKPFPLEEFGNYFSNFKESAFRLELLSIYSVPEEEEAFVSYLAGRSGPPEDFNKEWLDLLVEAKNKSKSFSRVRVIDGAISKYIQFEVDWAYRRNISVGEEIRFLMRDEVAVFKTQVPILKDFWLFDRKDCFLMEYDYYGRFLGVTRVPSEFVTYYIELMNEVIQNSIHLNQAEPLLKSE